MAGPTYDAMRISGNVPNPRDTTRVHDLPNIRFQGTDSQYQEVLDKANEVTMRKLMRRRTKLDVKIYELEVKLRMAQDFRIREIEKRMFNLETIALYGGA